ncbi:uncharacterized protein [Amphiura filiformis]|uniref:uncharacterized protein n=1 Tax=Amphiura filiformis TaxID=82378 RepID=UPI003B20EFA9
MAMFMTKFVLIFCITMSTLYGINCVQVENNTATANEVAYALPTENHVLLQAKMEAQDQKMTILLQNQQDNHGETIALLQNIVVQMAVNQQNKQHQITDLLQTNLDNHNETITLLQNQQHTLSRMVETQTYVANTLSQVVSHLEMQSEQLQYMAGSMNTMMSLLMTQQETTENTPTSPVHVQTESESAGQHQHPQTSTATQNQLPQTSTVAQSQLGQMSTVTLNQLPQTSTAQTTTKISGVDCEDLASKGDFPSGPYTITPRNDSSFNVYCDMDTDGGGWTLFQKRFDGSLNFYRGWTDYDQGFGDADGEYWVGLSQIHQLTQSGSWALRIDMESFGNETAYAEYQPFQVGEATSNYMLSIGRYVAGTAGDSLSGHNNMPFSTFDQDYDAYSGNCARNRQGAWWYNQCAASNLNGLYQGPTGNSGTGMWWNHWKRVESLKKSEMKIRRMP